MNIGPIEIVVVLVLALLVFGPSRLPQMGKSLGKGIREFRKAADSAKSELGLDEVTDQIKSVKSSVDDLKSSVDLKAAVEAPVKTGPAAAGAAGAALAATPAATAEPTTEAAEPTTEAAEPTTEETSEDVAEAAGTDAAEGETTPDIPVPPETPAAPEPPAAPDAGSPEPDVDAAPGS